MYNGVQVPLIPDELLETDDGSEWEDVPDSSLVRQRSDLSQTSRISPIRATTPGTPRGARRRKAAKTAVVIQSHLPPRRAAQASQPIKNRRQEIINSNQMHDALVYGAASSVRYFGSIFTQALWLLRRPLGFLLFLWILAFIMGKVSDSFRAVFAPICWIPFVSSLAICQAPRIPDIPQRADYPRLVEIQSSGFEQLLDGSIGGSALSLEVKKAEMATKDLITLVKYSKLKSRDLLAESLYNFVEDAKRTGRSLQKLTAKVNGAVDKIMAINDHALHTIEAARDQPQSVMRIIRSFGTATPPSKEAVIEAFKASMEVHASEMKRLILELQVSTTNLDRLDEHLQTLHELCTRENLTMSAERDALLAQLWTILGGNRDRVRSYKVNLELLRDLGEYRRRAAAHVAAALQTLQGMEGNMEDLRERVAAPEIVGDRIPLEVHMKSIRSGMERLRDERTKARERGDRLMDKLLGSDA